MQKHLDNKVNAAAKKNINLMILSEIKIPLPPAEMQKKIVESISLVDGKIAQLKIDINEKILYLNSLKDSILDLAFKGQL